ncbi:DNA-binding protein [Actinorhabdospora filicis]|uniref:DNA-binding protein n=1 Tax=Actinorhabdospora filicis TaxID=1785913 RepID=A0A9W6SMA5_9ACTN|nr:helix-turn-helix transcriptional regulator [Actinorhabdospora filicis]GLZ78510.1 DNA-binding protein [Actinorhabdospora filicis]
MDGRAELGEYLRSRRARIKPEDAGLQRYGERRRVPGLRREELAQLAGVSVDYYVRFEQGKGDGVSDAIIDAVAGALKLSEAETAHLHNLARAVNPRHVAVPGRQELRPGQRQLLDAMGDSPAYLVGRRTDMLAWNPLYAELLGAGSLHEAGLRGRQNTAWLVFCDEEVRGRYVNWETKAQNVVAYLRMDHGRHPGDPAFAALIEELTERSADFRRLWAGYEVADRTHGGYRMRHPVVGEFTVGFESFRASNDVSLIAYTAEPGTASADALRHLTKLVREAA